MDVSLHEGFNPMSNCVDQLGFEPNRTINRHCGSISLLIEHQKVVGTRLPHG